MRRQYNGWRGFTFTFTSLAAWWTRNRNARLWLRVGSRCDFPQTSLYSPFDRRRNYLRTTSEFRQFRLRRMRYISTSYTRVDAMPLMVSRTLTPTALTSAVGVNVDSLDTRDCSHGLGSKHYSCQVHNTSVTFKALGEFRTLSSNKKRILNGTCFKNSILN